MTPVVTVRTAVPGDAGELLTVQWAAFVSEAQRYGDPLLPPLREDLDGVAAAIAEPSVIVLVALAGTRLVGSVRLRVEGAQGHVGRLAVAPDQQGRGIGSRLLAAAENAAPYQVREFRLFTGADSLENVARYERAGYLRTVPGVAKNGVAKNGVAENGVAENGVDERGVGLVHLAKSRP